MSLKKFQNVAFALIFALPVGLSAKTAYEFFMSYQGSNIGVLHEPAYRALVEENSHFDNFGKFRSIVNRCAKDVDAEILEGIVRTESKFHPFAIGISKGPYIANQPKTPAQAVAMMRDLDRRKIDYSVGLGQINVRNFKRFGLTRETVLDPCENLKVAAKVLNACEDLVNPKLNRQDTIKATLVCYNTGNYKRSYRGAKAIESRYGNRVLNNMRHNNEDQALWWPDGAMEAYAKSKMNDEDFVASLEEDTGATAQVADIHIYTDEDLKNIEKSLALNEDSVGMMTEEILAAVTRPDTLLDHAAMASATPVVDSGSEDQVDL